MRQPTPGRFFLLVAIRNETWHVFFHPVFIYDRCLDLYPEQGSSSSVWCTTRPPLLPLFVFAWCIRDVAFVVVCARTALIDLFAQCTRGRRFGRVRGRSHTSTQSRIKNLGWVAPDGFTGFVASLYRIRIRWRSGRRSGGCATIICSRCCHRSRHRARARQLRRRRRLGQSQRCAAKRPEDSQS